LDGPLTGITVALGASVVVWITDAVRRARSLGRAFAEA
jgi:hypothetical protein